jgi:hypothetical protein
MLNMVTVVSSWFGRPPKVEFLLCHLAGAGVVWLALQVIVFPATSFIGWQANLYAGLFAFVTSACVSGLCLRLYIKEGGVVQSGLALALWVRNHKALSFPRLVAGLAVVALVAVVLLGQTSKMDWNYLMQKLVVLLIWAIAFRVCYKFAFLSPALRRHSMAALLTALLMVAGYRTLQATERSLWKRTGSKLSSGQFLDQYSGYDVSLKLIRDVSTPRQTVDPDFYRYLAKHTNIPRSTPTTPVDIQMVEKFSTGGPKPNIFILVVDSLRRDYLQPYNSKINFTPAAAAFAGESTVFENAFTHYGGTGLSEPSIWVGGMLLHQQYVLPFAPMDTLQKLLEHDEYKSFISRDAILETVVTPWKNYVPLDENRSTMDYDACSSLEELEGKIGAAGAPRSGLFAYTQAQNIHISRINREGAKPIDDANYAGFYAPYASRLHRVDGCFGKFIQYLKDKDIYDSSIVILTADHGDSLGEEGRWGHAYTIYPEIVRIPLIVHLPTSMRSLVSTPKSVAFSTDITPSLYYLLGHHPIVHHEFLGHPLFTEKPEEQASYRREYYLVASSYAAVYGILKGDGSQLFVSDGVNFKDYLFQLSGFGFGSASPSNAVRSEQQALIKEGVEGISKWYGLVDH